METRDSNFHLEDEEKQNIPFSLPLDTAVLSIQCLTRGAHIHFIKFSINQCDDSVLAVVYLNWVNMLLTIQIKLYKLRSFFFKQFQLSAHLVLFQQFYGFLLLLLLLNSHRVHKKFKEKNNRYIFHLNVIYNNIIEWLALSVCT